MSSTSTIKLQILLLVLIVFTNEGNVFCHSFSMPSPSKTQHSTPILTASSDEDEQQGRPFDFGCVANPVVLPPLENSPDGEWQCYYYGNDGGWNGGRKCFLPTGSTGLAISKDGVSWTKVQGKEAGGAILTPSADGSGKWDEVQTGVGDVVRLSKDELHMYYFGGSAEELAFGPGKIAGFRMRIGRARSNDNGRTWKKDDSYLLDYDESEGVFASWPRIVIPDDDSKPWMMYYHSFDGKKWRVYSAESNDEGDTWARTGLILEGGDSEDAFDFSGIGTRSVIKWRGGFLMIFEGVDGSSTHRLGAAFSEDGKTFTKLNDGNPILEPFKGPLGDWTKQVIGTPFVCQMKDGSLRLYHCGKDGPDAQMAIGVVESLTGDIGPESWTCL